MNHLKETIAAKALLMAGMTDAALSPTSPSWKELERLQKGSLEWKYGHYKSSIAHTVGAHDSSTTQVTTAAIIFGVMVVVVAIQYGILGQRVEAMLVDNLSIIAIVKTVRSEVTRGAAASDGGGGGGDDAQLREDETTLDLEPRKLGGAGR